MISLNTGKQLLFQFLLVAFPRNELMGIRHPVVPSWLDRRGLQVSSCMTALGNTAHAFPPSLLLIFSI